MRRVDAPRSGWYPDPEDRIMLRYWDGLDWTDVRRAPPSSAELQSAAAAAALEEAQQKMANASRQAADVAQTAARQSEPRDIIDEVRRATRGEVDRATDQFTRRARQMQQEITPLISGYTNRIIKWIRIALIVATVLLIAYFVFQLTAQASLFEWIGDRIDNLTDQNGAPLPDP